MTERDTNTFFANIQTGDRLTFGPFIIVVEEVRGRKRLKITKPREIKVSHRRPKSDLTNEGPKANNTD